MKSQYSDILEQIVASLPKVRETHPLSEPSFDGREKEYVNACIDTGWVSSVGSYVDKFETMLSEYTGAKYVVATNSGTAALHASLVVAGVTENDEVLMPAVSFVATANAAAYCGAIPHFVDSSRITLGVDSEKLENYLATILDLSSGIPVNKYTGRPVKALVVVHTFGHPVELDEIASICQKYKIALLEDAAEALGSYYKGRHVGNHGVMSALSFNGNKIITTGGGGAVLCNDKMLAKKVRHITTTAKSSHTWRFEHDQVGFNYRMPNINAALGCAQLERIENKLQLRRDQANRYKSEFQKKPLIRFVEEPIHTKSNYWLSTIMLSGCSDTEIKTFIGEAESRRVTVRPVWRLLNKLPMYAECPAMDLSTAEELERELICLPSC